MSYKLNSHTRISIADPSLYSNMAAPRATRPARYGALRVPAPPPGMVVELLTVEPTDPALVSVPELVSELELESVPVLVFDPLPELTVVWPVVPVPEFPLGASLTGAAAAAVM